MIDFGCIFGVLLFVICLVFRGSFFVFLDFLVFPKSDHLFDAQVIPFGQVARDRILFP